MKPEDRDAAYLWDMLQSARDAHELLAGRSLDSYLQDRLRRLALERALELVGEAARRVTETFQSAHPDIEWRSIIGQRNILAHQYGASALLPMCASAQRALPIPDTCTGRTGR